MESEICFPSASRVRSLTTLGNARLEIIPDAGHMPFWESPELFFTLIESFLSTPTP